MCVVRELLQVGAVFCDPHYMLLNGTAVTCNTVGWNVLACARSGLWNVSVEHQRIGGSPTATKVSAVRISLSLPDPFGDDDTAYQYLYTTTSSWQNQVVYGIDGRCVDDSNTVTPEVRLRV
jgi:hypothetical protein